MLRELETFFDVQSLVYLFVTWLFENFTDTKTYPYRKIQVLVWLKMISSYNSTGDVNVSMVFTHMSLHFLLHGVALKNSFSQTFCI